MGQLKALLPWQGTTLLQHQIEALAGGGVDETIVVLGHRAEELKAVLDAGKGVHCAFNPEYLQGKTTSIKAGVKALALHRPRVLLLLNVDQPRQAETIKYLLQRHLEADFLITIPTFGGKGGHPILLDSSLLEELLSIKEETQGIKAVTQRHGGSTQRVDLGTPEVLLDLNTPGEYERAARSSPL